MKFVYLYRTSDNIQHEGVVRAPDREAAFAQLRALGIRPSKVVEASGFWNKLLGKGKRWLAIAFLSVLLILSGIALFFSRRGVALDGNVILRSENVQEELSRGDELQGMRYADDNGVAIPITRRQIWGDGAVIDGASERDWACVFTNASDRLLAHFAIPGKKVASVFLSRENSQDFFAPSFASEILISENELEEFKQIKCIVAWMREELKLYLDDGGTPAQYVERLNERQNDEVVFCAQEKRVLDAAIAIKNPNLINIWNRINKKLRDRGLPVLSFPSD